jgi:putative NADH-flavin reductase
MRVAVLGATGRIGGHLVTAVLDAGYEVTALVRDPSALTGKMTVVTGTVTEPAAVASALDGADAVLSALGPRGAKVPGLLGTAARNLVEEMRRTGPRRVICVSAAGAFIQGDPDSGAIVKTILPRVLAKQFADVREMESAITASEADWTLVRATRLVNAPPTGRYRVRPDFPPTGGWKVARADVAEFMVAALAERNWVRARPALAY